MNLFLSYPHVFWRYLMHCFLFQGIEDKDTTPAKLLTAIYACEQRLGVEFSDDDIFSGKLASSLTPADFNPENVSNPSYHYLLLLFRGL